MFFGLYFVVVVVVFNVVVVPSLFVFSNFLVSVYIVWRVHANYQRKFVRGDAAAAKTTVTTKEYTFENIPSHIIDDEMFEARIEKVRKMCTLHADEGIFLRDSVTRRINRESSMFVGAPRAVLLQLAWPDVAVAVHAHTNLKRDEGAVARRFKNTFDGIMSMGHGTLDEAIAMARRIRKAHCAVQRPVDARRMNSNVWVFGTLIDTCLLMYDMIVRVSMPVEKQKFYEQHRDRFAPLLGIEPSVLPERFEDFLVCMHSGYNSREVCRVTREAREIDECLYPRFIRERFLVRVARHFTAFLLPHAVREQFDAYPNKPNHTICILFIAFIRTVYTLTPKRWRWLSTYSYNRIGAFLGSKITSVFI